MSIFDTGKPLNKFTKVVPVFLTINNEYAPYAAAAINSIIKHTNKSRYYRIIILHDGLSFKSRFRFRRMVSKNCAIQFKKITRSLYLKAIIYRCSHWRGAGDFYSSAVYYYRAFIPQLFPLYKKAIYIDSDTILRGDIGELYDIDLEGNVMAAMVDGKVDAIPVFRDYVKNALGLDAKSYVNSGVLVMDLKELRKMQYLKTMVGLIEKYDVNLVAPDQDYLNIILSGKVKFLDKTWNMGAEEAAERGTRKPKLVHFNLCAKPWFDKSAPCADLFWYYARGTGFYSELKRQLNNIGAIESQKGELKVAALLEKAESLRHSDTPIIKL